MVNNSTEHDVSLEQAKLVQYELLQSRVGLHGNRMWQLPLTYLGMIAISISVIKGDGQASIPISYVFMSLAVLGGILLWSLYGAYEGYSRTACNMKIIEAELKLSNVTNNHPSHSMPYFIIIIFGIMCCLFSYYHLDQQGDIKSSNSKQVISENK